MGQFWRWIVLMLWCFCPAWAEGARLEAVFPYSVAAESGNGAAQGSTQLFYVDIEQINAPSGEVRVTVTLPEGFRAVPASGWTVEDGGRRLWTARVLPDGYGHVFDAFPVKVGRDVPAGMYEAEVRMTGAGGEEESRLSFQVTPGEAAPPQEEKKKELGWYIQNVAVPVDQDGRRDDRQAQNTIFMRDMTLEGIRSRLSGGGAADWESVLHDPLTYALIELRNPRRDVRSLRVVAELRDRETGAAVPGLVQGDRGGAGFISEGGAAESVIALDGKTVQNVVLPLYGDPSVLEEGDYSLRVTIGDADVSRVTDIPVTVVKKRETGLAVLVFSLLCAAAAVCSLGKLNRCIRRIGAGGDIGVALFASLAFGGVVVPVTLFGDFLHVILGPFAGLATGLLTGVLQYLLLMALLVVFRHPGTAALFFLMKWLLAGLLFGRFTPVGALNYAVYIVVIEGMLQVSGFYRKKELTLPFKAAVSLLLGAADMGITFITLQQMMFFYRLYYADWFILLYMVVNGLVYTTAGSWMGIRIGERLRQVMGQ